MAFTPDLRDLHLTLSNGVVYGLTDDRPGGFQTLEYETQILPFRGVGDELERRGSSSRGDREMSIAMLEEEVTRAYEDLGRVAEDSRQASFSIVQRSLGFDPLAADERVSGESDPAAAPVPFGEFEFQSSPELFGEDQLLRDVAQLHRTNNIRWDVYRSDAYGKEVEIHKKYAIAFACFIFVLLGPPLAIRFPGGGLGMVIAASAGIFFFYWVGLIGGERLAERGFVNPAVAMWAPSVILLVPAVVLLATTAGRISTNRGSSWDELRYRVTRLFRFRKEIAPIAKAAPREGPA
jgi:lipopolysaccharide export system permease protein